MSEPCCAMTEPGMVYLGYERKGEYDWLADEQRPDWIKDKAYPIQDGEGNTLNDFDPMEVIAGILDWREAFLDYPGSVYDLLGCTKEPASG